jgi:hypothetical protein
MSKALEIQTTTFIIDRYNTDPARRRVKRTVQRLHEWNGLRRGMPMPGKEGEIISGFWRGKGGMYADYGPSIDEVSGWALVRGSQAV